MQRDIAEFQERRSASAVDFHTVEEKHYAIHERLLNWAWWCNGSGDASESPMFRLYRSSAMAKDHYGAASGQAVDTLDAARIAKAVIALPDAHRSAVNWSYVKPVSPARACRAIGVSMEGLALLVRDGRQMLVNRRA